MKKTPFYALLIAILFSCIGHAQNVTSTKQIYLSGKGPDDAVEWNFMCSEGQNSNVWTKIKVPSCWEQQGFGVYNYGSVDKNKIKSNSQERGYYKTRFFIHDIKNKNFRLVFQGVLTDAHVTLNGTKIGTHQGGYTQFDFNITNYIKQGENLLEVDVKKISDNKGIYKSEQVTDFWLFGGIFRPVYIDVLPTEYIERTAIDAKMDGAFEAEVYLQNISAATKVTAELMTLNGNKIGKTIATTIPADNNMATLETKFENVESWSNEYPNLYKIRFSLSDGKKVIHMVEERIGFRTFEVRDHDGFYLNGQRILLKGVNRHCFNPVTGRTLSKQNSIEDIKLLHFLNINFVRCSHYPPDKHFLEAADSMGILVMNELLSWHTPLPTPEGKKMVKELVIRDINHPSIILWSNGNHRAYNKELEPEFYKWDIQKRRALRNEPKKAKRPTVVTLGHDAVDTRFYPSYDMLTNRLADNHIVCPMECLHALYDGGGGSSLYDYWKAIKESKVGGGLSIWDFTDGGILRTDKNYVIDANGSADMDGIVGPFRELEGSAYAIRQVWSPVQISLDEISEEFTGQIPVHNEFDFVNLSECTFTWELVDFPEVHDKTNQYSIVHSGTAVSPDIAPENSGNIQIDLPADWKNADALKLKIEDHNKKEIWEWDWMIQSRTEIVDSFQIKQTNSWSFDKELFMVTDGKTKLMFDKNSGLLSRVIINGKETAFSNGLCLVTDPYIPENNQPVTTKHYKDGNNYVLEFKNSGGLKSTTWTFMNNGTVKLDYIFDLPENDYYYVGVGFRTPADKVESKKWLGKGPYRVWKSRTRGTTFNVWKQNYSPHIPGKLYNYPEFEGYFGPWYWAKIQFKNSSTIAITTPNDDTHLGVLKPLNGIDPKLLTLKYPLYSGLYVFNLIPAIGTKWREMETLGPRCQMHHRKGEFSGTLFIKFDNKKKK